MNLTNKKVGVELANKLNSFIQFIPRDKQNEFEIIMGELCKLQPISKDKSDKKGIVGIGQNTYNCPMCHTKQFSEFGHSCNFALTTPFTSDGNKTSPTQDYLSALVGLLVLVGLFIIGYKIGEVLW